MGKVFVMEFGEPTTKNVVGVDYNKRLVKLQSDAYYGSYWTSFDRCLSNLQVDYHFFCLVSQEIKRLNIKRTILEWKLKNQQVVQNQKTQKDTLHSGLNQA